MKTTVHLLGLIAVVAFATSCGGAGSVGGGNVSYGALVNSRFIDAPVQGLQYYKSSEVVDNVSADDIHVTGDNGSFQCLTGETVTFSLNALQGADLGRITCGATEVFPIDLNTVNGDSRKAQMIALLLHHMSEGFDGTNLIPASGTIVISSEAISFVSSYRFNLDDDNHIMAIINEIRVGFLDGTCTDPSFSERMACINAGETWSISFLSNEEFEDMLLAAQAHLEESMQLHDQQD
jgi:hypothetical protein